MSIEERHFSRQDLLDALEQGWKQYLPRLAALSEDEQARYAQEQGYARVQDVLVHIFSWWERSMLRSRRLVSGPPVLTPEEEQALFPDQTIDEFNAEVVARHQSWTRAAVEAHFAATLAALEQLLRDLPETVLEDERLHRWLRVETIDHYQEHRLPLLR